ncbi:hypothetical protein ACQP00_18475 [Dactylosporangium sp. CS-047395]|uniref:hypothetical protein n=1 Tax=Dactylosporangium sp. CS-047395 TaxID=3239936 RepID=UPI003D8A7DE6
MRSGPALDEVPWADLHGADGPSTRVPELLRALRDPDPAVREPAHSDLASHICGQSVWQVAAATVPFLVELVDDPATPDRPWVLATLANASLGRRDAGDLPFSAEAAYPLADGLTDEQERQQTAWLYDDQHEVELDDPYFWDRYLSDRWSYRAYQACVARLDAVVRWVADPDGEVVTRAAALLAWFPVTEPILDALLAAGAPGRASANLALAVVGVRDRRIEQRLHEGLASADPTVALTAAAALAYRNGRHVPVTVRRMLAACTEPPTEPLAGWDDCALPDYRALPHFVTTAQARADGGGDRAWTLNVYFAPHAPADVDRIAAAVARQDAMTVSSLSYSEPYRVVELTTRPMARDEALARLGALLPGLDLPESARVHVAETDEVFRLADIS